MQGAHNRKDRAAPFSLVTGRTTQLRQCGSGRRKARWRANLSTLCSAPCCSWSLPPALPGGRTGDGAPPHEAFAQAQDAIAPELEIVTDRPDITESSIVIPAGGVQVENGLTWTADHGQRTAEAPQSLLRVGVGGRTEVRLGIPDYVYSLGRHQKASRTQRECHKRSRGCALL